MYMNINFIVLFKIQHYYKIQLCILFKFYININFIVVRTNSTLFSENYNVLLHFLQELQTSNFIDQAIRGNIPGPAKHIPGITTAIGYFMSFSIGSVTAAIVYHY